MPVFFLVCMFPVMPLGDGPDPEKRQDNGVLFMLPEADHIIMKRIEVLFRSVMLDQNFRKVLRGPEPEFQGIEEQQDHHIEGQGIDRQAEHGEHSGQADGNHGHDGDQQYYPEIGSF
jgi:hypothetical protein